MQVEFPTSLQVPTNQTERSGRERITGIHRYCDFTVQGVIEAVVFINSYVILNNQPGRQRMSQSHINVQGCGLTFYEVDGNRSDGKAEGFSSWIAQRYNDNNDDEEDKSNDDDDRQECNSSLLPFLKVCVHPSLYNLRTNHGSGDKTFLLRGGGSNTLKKPQQVAVISSFPGSCQYAHGLVIHG